MCRRNQTRENEKPPCSRTKPDEGDDEGKDEAEGESRRRKTKEKDRDKKKKKKKKNKKNTREARCLPATGKSDQTGKQTKVPNTEKANTNKLKKKPCHNRHTIQISPRLGSAPRCRASRWAQYSSSGRCTSSRHSINARRSASNTTS